MPSDPLPLSPELDAAWHALRADFDRSRIAAKDGRYDEPGTAVISRHRSRIEQEARTLARAEVIAELTPEAMAQALVPIRGAHSGPIADDHSLHEPCEWCRLAGEQASAAALSRLGERE